METTPAKPKGNPEIPLDEWYPAISEAKNIPWRPIAAGLGAVAVIAAGGILMAELMPSPRPVASVTTMTTTTAAVAAKTTTATAEPVLDPCKGLPGELITSKDGNQDTPANLVAALEYAFYVKRDVNAVTALYAPNVLAASSVSSIGDFIAKIPPTTKYCVGIHQATPTTVDYDINEVRPTPGTQNYPSSATTFTESMTVTSSAPYFISSLHTRK